MRHFKAYEQKNCFYCGSKITKKDGHVNGVQRYKCFVCKRTFLGGVRLSIKDIWAEYTTGKQTYKQLGDKHTCSARTIQRKIDSVVLVPKKSFYSVANVLMDTTYFGRNFGVMVFKNSITTEVLLKYYVKTETNQQYSKGIEEIARRGIKIQSIVCDGRKGLFQLFGAVPVQMCQFHQMQIIKRYLTQNPKLEASKELRILSLRITKASKAEFVFELEAWGVKWDLFLKERTISSKSGKSYYTHKTLRSAYFSLKRNLPWLFIFEQYPEMRIPNTTNALEGLFSDLKNKLRNHNGMSLERKKKFIDGFFKA